MHGGARLRRFAVSKSDEDTRQCLRQLALSASRNFKYYRDLMQSAGIHPEKMDSVAALSRLPTTTKAEIPQPSSVRSGLLSGRPPVVRSATSGTLGQALFVRMSRAEWLFRAYSFFKTMEEHAAVTWPLSIAHVGSISLETAAPLSLPPWLLPVRVVRIPRHQPATEQADRLLAANCQVVSGHPTALEAVGNVLVQRRVKRRTKLIASRGEILSDRLRFAISLAFEGRLADYYNCEEAGSVAYECPADPTKMHVNTSVCLLEVVNERGEPQEIGVEGEVVITNLYNYTMPFIRYRLGDRSTLLSRGGGECECGSLRPTISPPAGRSDDYFSFPDERKLSPRAIEGLVILPLLKRLRADSPGVLRSPRYQIVQESMDTIRLLVDSPLGFTDELIEVVEASFGNWGLSVSLVVSEAADIPVENSGKTKTVISKVPQIRCEDQTAPPDPSRR